MKIESELTSRLDKWLYFLKHLEDFQAMPSIFKDDVFEQAFEKAELARMGQSDLEKYEMNLKVYRDNKAVYDYAIETAINKAKNNEKIEIARKLIRRNLTNEEIAEDTGLSITEIEVLRGN
ncbi:conserved hypothetical protein (putative transposase or invertase) [Flexibacter flexilis DSM 6793]|uniref:PD-(D/E)XK nuclease family transposase n=1 Tax=Flexibacter flexilis DSM 6793 TaxID=927664 RepID=A0A1I1N4G2_9BACT|nr:PD-(D/E)XK nuclease family transposase [Flexibacter flexilis]SFC92325.1 conserved hypothetical protein (putative transposase or invertase) [Flexibacter flexilis DSM 6793]